MLGDVFQKGCSEGIKSTVVSGGSKIWAFHETGFLYLTNHCWDSRSKYNSQNWFVIICSPYGKPLLCQKSGIDMEGRPVRLEKTVKMSARYIEMGSSVFSPILKAVVGELGRMIASNLLKINFVFSTNRFLTCWAFVK